MLNFTTLHFSKFRNAKLQKKVDLCNSGKSTKKKENAENANTPSKQKKSPYHLHTSKQITTFAST